MGEPEDKRRPADALREMAEGLSEQPDEAPDQEEPQQNAGETEEQFWTDQAEQAEPEVADAAFDDIPEATPVPTQRKRPSAGARTAGFHKLMIPMLLGVAAVLLILSGFTVFKLLLDGGDAEGPLQAYGWWLVLVSCPVAGVLVVAAWLLHHSHGRRRGA